MKKFLYFICFLFTTNCALASENKLFTIDTDNLYWQMNSTADETANVTIVEKDTTAKFISTVIKVSLYSALTNVLGENCDKFVKAHSGDKMLLYFSTLSEPKKNNYQFNSGNVYLITSSKTYRLKTINPHSGEYLNYNTNYVNGKGYYKNGQYYSPSFYYYKLPVICKDLDGASIKISGIYKNDKELPPIEFKINFLKQK